MVQIFTSFLLTSIIGTALALVLTLLKPITRKVFSGAWHYYMWLVVLVVMVLPLRFHLPEKPALNTPTFEAVTISEAQNETAETSAITEMESAEIVQEQTMPEEPSVQPRKASKAFSIKDFFSSNAYIFAFTWCIVAVLLFGIKVINYMRLLMQIRKDTEVIDCPEVRAYTKRNVKTRVSEAISSPLVIGIIRPTLLLPKTNITPRQLQNILAHEMTHLKRNDILYKWFTVIVKCIHWFNPAIYFISTAIHADCEISCDLEVVKEMDAEAKKGYAETILSLLTHNNAKTIPLTTGMTGNKKTLQRRFVMIKKKLKPGKKVSILSGVLAVLILATTVFASGVLQGKLHGLPDNSIQALRMDAVNGETYNVLFVGFDKKQAEVIMMLKIQEDGMNCVSIPKNAVFGDKRISDILIAENGEQTAIDVIRNTLSVPVHYYVKMDLEKVKEIVDSAGGLELQSLTEISYDDPRNDVHIRLKKGLQTLSGEEVYHLLRYRQPNAEDTAGGMRMFQQVMKAFIQQKLTGDTAAEIYAVIAQNIETNYPLEQDEAMRINGEKIFFETVPGDFVHRDGVTVYEIDLTKQTGRTIKASGLAFSFPPNADWIQDIRLSETNGQYFEVKYYDGILHADCKMIVSKGTTIPLSQYTFSPALAENWQAVEKPILIKVQQDPQEKVTVATWQYEDYACALIGEGVSGDNSEVSPIPKMAIYIINGMEVSKHENTDKNDMAVIKTAVSEADKNKETDKTLSKIKSAEISEAPYGGFEQIVIKNATTQGIESKLMQNGITRTSNNTADLSKNYIVNAYTYEDSLQYDYSDVKCDENGNISMYFAVNNDNLVDIRFFDTGTKEEVGQYGVWANNENAYTFIGFSPEKTYDISIRGKTKDTWKIEGEHIIY